MVDETLDGTVVRTYRASCHCGRVSFRFRTEPIKAGYRCNCSYCVRRGIVVGPTYLPPDAVDEVQGMESLILYRFGEQSTNHYFCGACGICPFHVVAFIPDGYVGTARPGYYRVNLGCVHDLDVYALDIRLIDGRSF
jgi:hypothetical protein